ncbi:hypothetical protein [Streptomyces hiroshimensis]|uniref:Uncharacterized protein n=1 Tax=Streptomyces hiroshimensis TaxID=66424 RepID=A0ABQ2Z2B3_9ACTN|nr:hypothetical protein [Streptomyces hiroshimensis]GGY00790.1 hypothetical protein GCM10010324_54290 [Streptomyces hiroshimensis]
MSDRPSTGPGGGPEAVQSGRRECEFSNSHLLWKGTGILTDEAGAGEDRGVLAGQEEADGVLHELKGRPGITELGESGPHSPRPFGSFRYFITGDDPEDPWGLWRLDADGRWQHFSALEWGWFPGFWGDDFTVGGRRRPPRVGAAFRRLRTGAARRLAPDRHDPESVGLGSGPGRDDRRSRWLGCSACDL